MEKQELRDVKKHCPHVSSLLASMVVSPCPTPNQHSLPCLLAKFPFQLLVKASVFIPERLKTAPGEIHIASYIRIL